MEKMVLTNWSLSLLLMHLVSAEVASNYALLIPAVKNASNRYYNPGGGSVYNGGGSGYNDGGGGYGYSSGGSGYYPGVTGGSGYNPGYPGSSDIAFAATRADSCCRRTYSRVRFERSLTNLGGGWDARAGLFSAPETGTYTFSWTALSPDRSELRLGLMMNGLEMASSWADSQGYQSSSGSLVLSLRRGDEVSLEVSEGELFESRTSGRGYTTFSGYKI